MFATAVNDLTLLMVFLLLGFVIREIVKPLQKLFLPSALIGGAVALVLGPQVLGLIDLPESWSGMATPMINVVLTCTMFGTVLNKSKIKTYAGAINLVLLTYVAQLFIGTLVGMGLSKIWPDLPYGWGVMTVFTYWGGHGAGASAGGLFEELGVNGMVSIGIILATLGLIVAMLAGMVVVNYGARKGYATNISRDNSGKAGSDRGVVPVEKQKSLGRATVSSDAVNGLAMQLCLVMLSMWIGRLIFTGIAKVIPAASNIPELLYGIVGAALVWFLMRKTHLDGYADKQAVDSISGVALEICICSATATLDLQLFASFLAPILIHMCVIIALMVLVCVVLLRRWMKKDWFELCLMAFGQGHGSTPSGLALARCVDPDHKSVSWEAFGVAVGVISPFTSVCVAIWPVLAMQSLWIIVAIGGVMTLACLLFGELVLRKRG